MKKPIMGRVVPAPGVKEGEMLSALREVVVGEKERIARADAEAAAHRAVERAARKIAPTCTCDPPRPDRCTCGSYALLDALARLDAVRSGT